MVNQPRRHHYVPQFYLKGFTDDGTDEGSLSVLDTKRLKEWSSKPKDAAHRRDFHKIDGPSGDPMIVEKLLAQFEGKWSSVLRALIEERQIPDDDRFGDLMMFVAFMAVRVPRIRNKISEFIDDVRRKEQFAKRWLEKQGHAAESANDEIDEAFDQTWHVQQMVEMAATLAPLLGLRLWQLWIADSDVPDFICSDSPVSLNWLTPVPGLYPPGYHMKNTVVSIPLQKRMAIVGLFDGDDKPRIVGSDEIAQVNSATGMHAEQLYYSGTDFAWFTKSGEVGWRADLLKTLQGRM